MKELSSAVGRPVGSGCGGWEAGGREAVSVRGAEGVSGEWGEERESVVQRGQDSESVRDFRCLTIS